VSLPTDLLLKSNGTAAWPEFLQSVGSPRTGAQLKAKLTRIQKMDRPPEPDRAEQLSNKAPFMWWHDSRLTGIRDSRIQRVIRANGSPMHLNRFTGIWEDGRGSDYAASQGGQGAGGSQTPGVALGDRATEVLHLVCIPHPIFPYGIPRWIHQIPSVLGSRRAEEWNLGFFEQGGIPPMLIVVQGGEAADNVEEAIKNLFYSAGPQKTTAAVLQVQSTSGDMNDPGAVKVTVERFGCYSEDTEVLTENGWSRCWLPRLSDAGGRSQAVHCLGQHRRGPAHPHCDRSLSCSPFTNRTGSAPDGRHRPAPDARF
jgi:hypothetical protein